MKISHHALYSNLVYDLAHVLPRNGTVPEEWTVREFAAQSLLDNCLRKFSDGKTEAADAAALDKFLVANFRCKEWSYQTPETLHDELEDGLFRQELYRFFCPNGVSILDWSGELKKFARPGPGASLLANGDDFYTKMFSSRLSSTSETVDWLYQSVIRNDPLWSEAELLREQSYGPPLRVPGNRLSFVEKNHDISRVICTEPSVNMFLQLGIGGLLSERLRRYFGLDIRSQQVYNRVLAQVGSRFDSYVTIDLSSASDSVSLGMLREYLPKVVLPWLEMTRSPTVTLPNGEVVELSMISSMGNGFTFPLQTAIFACVVSACYHAAGIRKVPPHFEEYTVLNPPSMVTKVTKELPGNFAVFGDDIIADKRVAHRVVRLLCRLGFSVNKQKSFLEGWFRESCGGDFWKGHPVKPVYIKRLDTAGSRYVAINRLNYWSAETGIQLPHTIRYLLRSVRYLPVPIGEADDVGIRLPLSCVTKVRRRGGLYLYKKLHFNPPRLCFTDGEVRWPRGHKARIFNEPAVILALLRGDIEGGQVMVRHPGHNRTHPKVACSPNWDYLPAAADPSAVGWRRLASAVYFNLYG